MCVCVCACVCACVRVSLCVSMRRRPNISCEPSASQAVHMNIQALFSWNNNNNNLEYYLLQSFAVSQTTNLIS